MLAPALWPGSDGEWRHVKASVGSASVGSQVASKLWQMRGKMKERTGGFLFHARAGSAVQIAAAAKSSSSRSGVDNRRLVDDCAMA